MNIFIYTIYASVITYCRYNFTYLTMLSNHIYTNYEIKTHIQLQTHDYDEYVIQLHGKHTKTCGKTMVSHSEHDLHVIYSVTKDGFSIIFHIELMEG